MELLKGAPVSAAIREWAAEEIKQLQGSVPKLAIYPGRRKTGRYVL